jgi:hypothetical protein
MRAANGYGQVRALIRTASISLPAAREEVLQETIANLERFANLPMMQEIFAPGSKALEVMGGLPGAVKIMAGNQITSYMNAVTTAALIFAHSILDAAVIDFCRLIAEIAPKSWDPWLDTKTIRFEQVRSSSVEAIRSQLLESFLDQLEREALPRRIEKLLAVCKPSATTLNSEGYIFDLARIRRVDDQRHRLMHGGAPAPTMQELEEEVRYLEATTYRLMSCLFEPFDIYPDPTPVT